MYIVVDGSGYIRYATKSLRKVAKVIAGQIGYTVRVVPKRLLSNAFDDETIKAVNARNDGCESDDGDDGGESTVDYTDSKQ